MHLRFTRNGRLRIYEDNKFSFTVYEDNKSAFTVYENTPLAPSLNSEECGCHVTKINQYIAQQYFVCYVTSRARRDTLLARWEHSLLIIISPLVFGHFTKFRSTNRVHEIWDIHIVFRIFWRIRKSRLSQPSDVDNCSRWAQSLDFLRMRNCISHAGFGRFLTRDERHWSIKWTKISVMSHAWWDKCMEAERGYQNIRKY